MQQRDPAAPIHLNHNSDNKPHHTYFIHMENVCRIPTQSPTHKIKSQIRFCAVQQLEIIRASIFYLHALSLHHCQWSSLDSQQQDSFNQRSHTSHNCMMMWIYILQNDRNNINNQLSWSLKVWYASSIHRKETLHATAPPQRESSAIDFPPAIFSYHSSKNSQHQESSQL